MNKISKAAFAPDAPQLEEHAGLASEVLAQTLAYAPLSGPLLSKQLHALSRFSSYLSFHCLGPPVAIKRP